MLMFCLPRLTDKYNSGRTDKYAKPPFEGVSFAGYLPAN